MAHDTRKPSMDALAVISNGAPQITSNPAQPLTANPVRMDSRKVGQPDTEDNNLNRATLLNEVSWLEFDEFWDHQG